MKAAAYTVNCNSDLVIRETELITAFEAANATLEDDVIELASECTYVLTAENDSNLGPSGLPTIVSASLGGALTVHGNGAIIERSSATSVFRILRISSGAVVFIDNVTLRFGHLNSYYNYVAGVYNAGDLTLSHSTVSDNTSEATSAYANKNLGGGIYNEGTLALTDTLVADNTVRSFGGNIYNESYGGGIYNRGALTIAGSTIRGNSTYGAGRNGYSVGGGIANYDTLTVSSSLFEDNTTGYGYGGAILDAEQSSLTVTNSTFRNNSAAYAGGINNNRSIAHILSSTFDDNISSTGEGGAIDNYQGVLIVIGTVFTNNHAYDVGGAIGNTGVSYLPENGILKVAQSSFGNNTSNYGGGAISASGGTVELTSSTFASNRSMFGGGFRGTSDTNIIISNSTFVGNRATNNTGGGIASGSSAIIHNTLLADNLGANNGNGNCSGVSGGTDNISSDTTCSGFRVVSSTQLKLDPRGLRNNGGETPTIALLNGSQAIDTGNATFLPLDTLDLDNDGDFGESIPVDQTTYNRVFGNGVDVGAYEYRPVPIVIASKTALDTNGGSSVPGDTLRYRITVSNQGDLQATQAILTDTIPDNTTYVAGSTSLNGIPIADSDGNMPFGGGAAINSPNQASGIIGEGENAEVVFDVIIDILPADIDNVTNQGTVTYQEQTEPILTDDPTTLSANDATQVTVIASPIIRAVKTASDLNGGYTVPGDTLHYTVTIANVGNQHAGQVVFTDSIDPNTTIVPKSITTSQGHITSGNDPVNGQVGVTLGLLEVGSTATIEFNVIITDSVAQGITAIQNQGAVNGSNFSEALTDDDGNGIDATTVDLTSGLTIDVTFLADTLYTHQNTTLRFTLRNPDSNPALTNLGFSAQLPVGLGFQLPSNAQCSGDLTLDGTTLIFTDGILDAGLSECTIDLTVIPSQIGIFNVTVSPVTADAGVTSALGDSAQVQVTFGLATPLQLFPTDMSSTTQLQPVFGWTAVTSGATYEVQLGRNDESLETIATVSDDQYSPSTRLLMTTYSWRVRAHGQNGEVSNWSPTWHVTIASPENAVPQLNLATDNMHTLSWGHITWAKEYEIQVDTNPSFVAPYVFTAQVSSDTDEIVVGPLGNGTYFWRVRARHSDESWGAWSAASSFIISVP